MYDVCFRKYYATTLIFEMLPKFPFKIRYQERQKFATEHIFLTTIPILFLLNYYVLVNHTSEIMHI